MSDPSFGKRGKVPWTRIGVLLDETSEWKPLLGLAPSRDGGLMISPSYLPAEHWHYGVRRIPAGAYKGLQSELGEIHKADVVPKMHYHKSGWLSVNLTGSALPRASVKCLPLERMRGAQCFTAVIINPHLASSGDDIGSSKAGDLFYAAHGSWPTLLTIHGFVYSRDQVPDVDRVVPGPLGFVINHRVENVIELSHYGIDAVLALVFRQGKHSMDPKRVEALLFGFDYRMSEDGIADTVGMWTCNAPPHIPTIDPANAPFATIAFPRPTSGIVSRKRRLGGPAVEVAPFSYDDADKPSAEN